MLKKGSEPIGITTLDIVDKGIAVTRSVAINKDFQGQGHGKILGKMVQDFAKTKGIEKLCVNADSEKTSYYESLGFHIEDWDLSEFSNVPNPRSTQMVCKLK